MQRYIRLFFQTGTTERVMKILESGMESRTRRIKAEPDDLMSLVVSAGELAKVSEAASCRQTHLALVHPVALARMGKLIPAGVSRDSALPYIRVRQHPLRPEGLYFTTYSHLDVKHHLGTRTLAEKTGMHHIQLHEGRDPLASAVEGYEFERAGRDWYVYPPLVIYQVLPRGCME